MKGSVQRLLRVRRLLEDVSRVEFGARSAEQLEMEDRREAARGSSQELRRQARAVLAVSAAEERKAPAAGLWHRLLADSEGSSVQEKRWDQAAREAAVRAGEAERRYMTDRMSRMQVEIVVRERAAAERLEQDRREQREVDDWFVMARGLRLRRMRGEKFPT